MLFFGPSFSHLVCYFGYFLEIQYLSNLKKEILVCQIWVKNFWENSCSSHFNHNLCKFMQLFAVPKLRGQ